MHKKEQEKSEAYDLVQVVKTLGVVILAVVILFLLFAKEQLGQMSTIIWAVVVLGIVFGLLIKRTKRKR